MEDYSPTLIINILKNLEIIDSFLERTTGELFTVNYSKDDPENFFLQEGHTLMNDNPNTTRVPGKDSLKENLLILRTDILTALRWLSPAERLAVYHKYVMEGKSKFATEVILEKMCEFLNYGESTYAVSC